MSRDGRPTPRRLGAGLEVTAILGPLAIAVIVLSTPSLASPLLVAESAGARTSRQLPAAGNGLKSDAAAMHLLTRAAEAPKTTAYTGVQFVSAWTEQGASGLVVEVSHSPTAGTTVQSVGNAQVESTTSFVPVDAPAPSLGSVASGLALLAANFSVTLTGVSSVAGRPAQIVEARRRGTMTLAARFWLDQATSLVLRREVYDELGKVTRASAFVEVTVGKSAPRSPEARALPSAWPERVPEPTFEAMRARGWKCPERLSANLSLIDARRGGKPTATDPQPILHLSYSDGLSSISLFEQRGHLGTAKLDGYRAAEYEGGTMHILDGIPKRMVWSADGMVFTLVADAPDPIIAEVMSALPAPDPEPGRWGRLQRGMDRVASWFNPFG